MYTSLIRCADMLASPISTCLSTSTGCMAWSTHNVLDEVGEAKLAQGPQSKASDGGILVSAVFGEEVYGEQGQIRVVLCVGCDVQVQHLL